MLEVSKWRSGEVVSPFAGTPQRLVLLVSKGASMEEEDWCWRGRWMGGLEKKGRYT